MLWRVETSSRLCRRPDVGNMTYNRKVMNVMTPWRCYCLFSDGCRTEREMQMCSVAYS